MRKKGNKRIKNTAFGLIIAIMLGMMFTSTANAQSVVDAHTVGLWHLDEVKPDGYREITLDATGINHGTLGADSPPVLVEGKFGKALKFDGSSFVYVPIAFLVGFPPTPEPIYIPISPNLDIQEEIKIEAWINVQGFKDATYNNIAVKCTHPDPSWQNTSRVVGLAIRAGTPEDGVEIPEGSLSGFVLTDSGGFNEIVTTEPVIPLNQWTHVAFTRSATGMHLYVNGYEKNIKVIHGVQNPGGNIINGTEYYFGHDALVTIDELRISNLAPETPETAAFDIGPNIMIAVIVVSVIFAIAWLLRRVIQIWVIRPKP